MRGADRDAKTSRELRERVVLAQVRQGEQSTLGGTELAATFTLMDDNEHGDQLDERVGQVECGRIGDQRGSPVEELRRENLLNRRGASLVTPNARPSRGITRSGRDLKSLNEPSPAATTLRVHPELAISGTGSRTAFGAGCGGPGAGSQRSGLFYVLWKHLQRPAARIENALGENSGDQRGPIGCLEFAQQTADVVLDALPAQVQSRGDPSRRVAHRDALDYVGGDLAQDDWFLIAGRTDLTRDDHQRQPFVVGAVVFGGEGVYANCVHASTGWRTVDALHEVITFAAEQMMEAIGQTASGGESAYVAE